MGVYVVVERDAAVINDSVVSTRLIDSAASGESDATEYCMFETENKY